MNSDEQKDISAEQLRKKAERRRELANLSIEEKLKRLVKLQKVAYSVGMQAGRHPRKPWGTQK